MRASKQYTVKIVSTGNPYDETQLFKSIFDSLYSIRNNRSYRIDLNKILRNTIRRLRDNPEKSIIIGRISSFPLKSITDKTRKEKIVIA